ncbi:MAG TPA: zinc-dependent metalloprotease [Dinghuibacter sp.]|uniref:zinc-dependent metalloprotease n=1 Tax=Dinghuibacter sp. TaxID=2024697 RepID=UPI002C43DF60|nr:zinc-dependent metalloprotease [Dinghuibacter sp.]HTJ12144.1 zinc-dependent metalloprotease [Dinghuibacter sp.]
MRKLFLLAVLSTTIASAQNREAHPAATLGAITQNLKKFEGFYTFYYDDKTGKVYLQLDRFNEEFLYFRSMPEGIGNGGPERGQASAVVAKFIKAGAKILLLQPNYYAYRGSGSADEQKAATDAFAQSVLWGFSPAAVEGDKVLIDLTPFLVRDALDIGGRIGSGRGNPGSAASARGGDNRAGGGYRLDETRSAINIDNTRDFPKNTEFEAWVTFTGNGEGGRRGGVAPDPGAVTVRLHQSFVQLPDSNFHARAFDPRSGFFDFEYQDFSAAMSEPLTKRFIERHRLQKKDPKAAVSEPVEPIVYYIDPGAPPLIRQALVEGGSWWNQAFEAAGFKNAFQVKVLPEGADPMDIRYNMVNWVDRSGYPARAFSYGASYIDPRTGEIIKGVVTLGSDRHREDFLIAEGLLQPYENGKPVSGEMQRMALARIRQLSAHEIGHTLGLTHNFAASIKDRASVMDYPFPRFTVKTDGSIDLSDVYATGIGSWDKRAITWGYSEFAPGADEQASLDKIMRETLKEGFRYIPDVGGGAHPLSNQWDDGPDPIAQLDKLMKARRMLLDRFSEKAIPQGAPMATLEEVLVPIYLLHRYQVEAVSKYIGGLYFTHAVKDDGQVPTEMVTPEDQWKALSALMGTISPAQLALPEKLIKSIPPRPSGYPSSIETFGGHTGPTFDPLGAAESDADNTLSYLFDEARAARLIEYHARDERQPGLMPMLDTILNGTWKAPLAPGYAGELQIVVDNLVLKHLLGLAVSSRASESVRGEAMLEAHDLYVWINAHLGEAGPRQKAAFYFALEEITEFDKDPAKFTPDPSLEMPPGAPIGD